MDGQGGDHHRSHPVLEPPLSLPAVGLPDDLHPLLQAIDDAEEELKRILADEVVAGRIARQLRRADDPRTSDAGHPRLPHPADRPPLQPTQTVGRPRLLEEIDLPTDPAAVARLHRRLQEGPGTFRKGPAALGAPPHEVVSPEPPRIPELLEAILQESHDSPHHPVITSCILTGRLLWIRPFASGNRDIGRLLGRVLLLDHGYTGAAFIPWGIDDGVWQHVTDTLARAVAEQDATAWLRAMVSGYHDLYLMVLGEARHVAAHVDALNERQWRVAQWFRRSQADDPDGRWRFRHVQSAFPYVAARTLKRDLAKLRAERLIVMEGRLKSARYHYTGPSTPTSLERPYARETA